MVRTGILIVLAVVLAGVTWITRPKTPVLAQFSDQGQAFYPAFTDPLAATALEVIDFDPDTASTQIFKVEQRNGVWSIPSHYDYPADAEDQLARTAASLVDLHKDIFQSDRVQDHESFGVIDPLDASSASLDGRGAKITLFDSAGGVLASFIIGHPVEGKDGFRYVRVPDSKRTYASRIDIRLTTRFADWIDTDVFEVGSMDMTAIDIRDYSINESTGQIDNAGAISLRRDENDAWVLADPSQMPANMMIDQVRINQMSSALARMTITGVRPKPAGLTASLEQSSEVPMDPMTGLSLQSMGYFFSPDGSLLSNEGEITVGTSNGVRYLIRFGEIATGEGDAITRGLEQGTAAPTDDPSAGENRYLFVTASFDDALVPDRPEEIPIPEDMKPEIKDAIRARNAEALEQWKADIRAGRETAERLNRRFAPWYYMISSKDDQALRLGQNDVFVPAEATAPSTDG
ncbi:MAG: DUF4340 domain-containing protein [Phycisphaerales bacterium]|nr:DUF4340 domain-containing protein [Phycisphaerales bacterium]